jgi:hypothetical protein
MFAATRKNIDPQFILKQAYLPADARLRSEEVLRGRGNIKFILCDFPDVTELLQFHVSLGVGSIWWEGNGEQSPWKWASIRF